MTQPTTLVSAIPSRPDLREVLHIFACWETRRRMPRPGEAAVCGWTAPVIEECEYKPHAGNEHKACVVCESLWASRWRRHPLMWLRWLKWKVSR